MSLFLNLFVFFFWKKSYHSNLAITFYVDYESTNGFQHLIDRPRNCPFQLPDDRWRHIRLRNGRLNNLKKWKSFKAISEKGMNRELTKIAPNSSYISILVNRQSFLTSLVAHQVLEKILYKIFGNFDDFLHILAQNFSRWPKILNIVCLLTKTVTREQSQSIFITSELIPFLWERLKLCPSDQKYKIS